MSEDRDAYRDEVKAAFVRNPEPLIRALGLHIDERRTKPPQVFWVHDGAEQVASLQIGGKPGMEGLCTRYGEEKPIGDCFALYQRQRGGDFPAALEYVANLYGVKRPDEKPRKQEPPEKPVAERSYPVMVDGRVVVIHKRLDFASGEKRMWWEQPDGTRAVPEGLDIRDLPLWRSERLAEFPTRTVLVCEGEKDADSLTEHGCLAVGTYGASVVPSESALSPLIGRKVVLWPDNDAPGRKHMEVVARALAVMGHHCYVLEWPDAEPKAGAADWFALGLTVDELKCLVKAAKPWAMAFGEEATQEEAVAAAVNEVPTYTPPPEIVRGVRPIAEIAAESMERLEARRALPRRIYGMRSGWRTLDWWYLGFKWEGLVVVSGATGSGKTTVARHFLFESAKALLQERSDEKLLSYVFEGGRDQFLRRYASWEHGIPWQLMSPGSEDHMTEAWERRLGRVYRDFPNLPLEFCDATTDAWEILADIRRRASEGPIAGVVIDNVQNLTYKGGNDYQNNKGAASEALKLCDALEVPIIVLSQINRDGNTWRHRGGPEWAQNATCEFYIRRGERGVPVEEENASNVTTIHNKKRRGEGPVCPALKLVGDLGTGRLYEEPEWERLQAGDQSRTRERKPAWESR